jgi:hypothetical protein
VQAPAREQAIGWLQEALDRAPKALDTHPTLRQRLRALLPHDDERAAAPPEALCGPSAAQVWFGPLADRLRDEQQRQWAERVAQPWRERHAQWQQRRARLNELAAVPEPDADQQLELVRLRIDLEPQHDHLPALVAFNAAHPDHAVALFAEGDLRLDRSDDLGIALIERAMALDAAAIKPGCERACAYLSRRNDPRAEGYQRRWIERDEWETRCQQQIDTLQPTDRLVAAELDADTMRLVHTRLRAHGPAIARAWLARRVIEADASVRCYVLAIEPTRWTRWRKKAKPLIHALAGGEWPIALHVCLLDNHFKPLRKQLQQLPAAQLS